MRGTGPVSFGSGPLWFWRQADLVDAVALVGRGAVALTLDVVAEVRAVVSAPALGTARPERAILDVLDAVLGERREERRPAALRVELGVGAEQFGVAGPALVDTDGLGVGVLAGERPFGAPLAEYVVLGGGELLTPLGVGLLDLVTHVTRVRTRSRGRWAEELTKPGHQPSKSALRCFSVRAMLRCWNWWNVVPVANLSKTRADQSGQPSRPSVQVSVILVPLPTGSRV